MAILDYRILFWPPEKNNIWEILGRRHCCPKSSFGEIVTQYYITALATLENIAIYKPQHSYTFNLDGKGEGKEYLLVRCVSGNP